MVISHRIPAVVEEKTLFRTLPWKRKQLEIEANSRNSIPWNKNRSKLSERHSEPFSGRRNNSEQNAAAENFKISVKKMTLEIRTNHFVNLFWLFCKTNLSAKFRSIPFCSELWNWFFLGTSECLGNNEHFLPRNNGNRFLSLFRGIYSEQNSVPNLTSER